MGKKLISRRMTALIKKLCRLKAENEWMLSVKPDVYSLGGRGDYVQVFSDWFHENTKDYQVTKLPEYKAEYHWVEQNGVTIYCFCEMEAD